MAIVSSVVHAGSPKTRPQVDLDDINYQRARVQWHGRPTAEAKVATVLYARELAERLEGTGVSAVFSVHPGCGPVELRFRCQPSRCVSLMALDASVLVGSWSDSNEESAQTTLHCLISDDAPDHSGAYFSQSSVLYRDKECRSRWLADGDPQPERTQHGHGTHTGRHELPARRTRPAGSVVVTTRP